jgi:hypothetical protein
MSLLAGGSSKAPGGGLPLVRRHTSSDQTADRGGSGSTTPEKGMQTPSGNKERSSSVAEVLKSGLKKFKDPLGLLS